jgi:hypothetical protein
MHDEWLVFENRAIIYHVLLLEILRALTNFFILGVHLILQVKKPIKVSLVKIKYPLFKSDREIMVRSFVNPPPQDYLVPRMMKKNAAILYPTM